MRTHFLIPGLLVLFVVIAFGWFHWKSPKASAPAADPAAVESMPPPAARMPGAGSVSAGHPTPNGQSPFLTTHERGTSFTPTGENLAPSFHVEMEAIRKRLEEAPQDTTMLIRMARLKQDGHQTEEAVSYYRQYLALHPGSRQAWIDLTQCYGALEQWDEALKATEEMLGRFPDDPGGLYNLGAIYANMGRLGEAKTTWERVVAQDGNPEMKTLAEGALQRLKGMQAHP